MIGKIAQAKEDLKGEYPLLNNVHDFVGFLVFLSTFPHLYMCVYYVRSLTHYLTITANIVGMLFLFAIYLFFYFKQQEERKDILDN